MPGYPPRHVCALPNYFRSLLHLPPQHDTAPHITEARTLTDVRSRGSCAQFVSHITRRLRSRHSVITLRSRSQPLEHRRLITRPKGVISHDRSQPLEPRRLSHGAALTHVALQPATPHVPSPRPSHAPSPIAPSIPRPITPFHPTPHVPRGKAPATCHALTLRSRWAQCRDRDLTLQIPLGAMPRSRRSCAQSRRARAREASSRFARYSRIIRVQRRRCASRKISSVAQTLRPGAMLCGQLATWWCASPLASCRQ